MEKIAYPKCLVVDDTQDYLDLVVGCLQDNGIQNVSSVNDAREVIPTLEAALKSGEPFDLLLTDNFMPYKNGSELLKECRQHRDLSSLPVVIMTGDPESFTAKECLSKESEAKADDYIIKPFQPVVLIRKVMALYRLHSEESIEFHPIRSSTLFVNTSVPFDIFIQSYDQYRLLVETEDIMTKRHVDLFSKHNVKRLYISASDETKYQKYLDKNLRRLMDDKELSIKDKAEIVSDYGTDLLKESFADPQNISIASLDKVSNALSMFMRESSNKSVLELLKVNDNPSIYKHSLNVASICLLITHQISLLRRRKNEYVDTLRPFDGLFGEETASNIVLMEAALLHDIGKTSERYVEDKEYPSLHITTGIEMLQGILGLNSKIPEIIERHEEFCDGTGGPLGLLKNKISIFSQILCLANQCEIQITENQLNDSDLRLYLHRNRKKFNQAIIDVFLLTMK